MARTVATKQSQGKEREHNSKERSPQQEQQTNPYSKIFSLQRTVGNRAVEQMMYSGMVNSLGTGAILQRKCACGGAAGTSGKCAKCSEEETLLQRHGTGEAESSEAPLIVHEVLNSSGQTLAPEIRVLMESYLGSDFSRVRIHTDAKSAESARAVNALAYTVGRDIVFAAGQYSPKTNEGQQLLAHELIHVLQQKSTAYTNGSISILDSSSQLETEADTFSNINKARQDISPTSLTLARRGPIPVARPPVRTPVRVPSGTAPRYAPIPDDSLEGIFQRAREQADRESAVMEMERPIATLNRGGQPPDFITVAGTGQIMGNFGTATYRRRVFHILDAIEYQVNRANTEDDLFNILQRYIPSPGNIVRNLRTRPSFTPSVVPLININFLDTPIIPRDFDPRGEQRLQVYNQAVTKRSRTISSLTSSRATPVQTSEEMTRRGCSIRPINSLGNDLLATLFCQVVAGTPFSYWIESTAGRAEIDALRGNTWYECKCGYKSLVQAVREGRFWSQKRLDELDEQVLRHQRIARQCGLQYRFIVSNEQFAELLRRRWFGIDIEVVQFEPCD
jgi:hypothetical protein